MLHVHYVALSGFEPETHQMGEALPAHPGFSQSDSPTNFCRAVKRGQANPPPSRIKAALQGPNGHVLARLTLVRITPCRAREVLVSVPLRALPMCSLVLTERLAHNPMGCVVRAVVRSYSVTHDAPYVWSDTSCRFTPGSECKPASRIKPGRVHPSSLRRLHPPCACPVQSGRTRCASRCRS